MPLADPSQNTMSIVAHPDDDLLFMNPDIRSSIEAGGGHTTVFLTAGDAGYGAEHWAERELGIKAAYGDMAGSRIWVDELVQLTDGSREIELHSSHLAAAPEVRVYFLRLPDGNPGGSGYGVTGNQSLAQLWDGDIDRADTVDGHDSFSRIDVIRILDALMEHHGPETVMMQDYQSDHADEEHSDHLHSAQFSHAALALYSHEHEVQAHINYGTQHLPQNVAHPEYVESAENFAHYADHDFTMYYTLSSEGVPMFGDPVDAWLARQYTFDPGEAALDDLAGHADFVVLEETLPDPDAPPPDDGLDYALEGPDAFLFQVNQDTGEISPQDWFVPSASDAWDQNEDHVYEVTRITSGEGVDVPVHEGFEMSVTEAGISWTALDGSSVEPVPDPDPDPVPVPDPDPEPLPDPDPVPPAPDVPVAGLQYSLEGPDAYLFQIDIATGEISPQGWFSPSLADAWDQGENHVYEVTRVADPGSGGDVTREFLEMSVTADGTEWQIAGEPSPEPEDDPSPDPGTGPSADGPGPVPGTGGMASEGVRFELDGPDVFLFDVDGATGLVQTKPWFVPDPDDPWDQGENNVYDLVLVSRNDLTGDSEETPLSFTLDPSGRWEMLSDAGELPPGDSVPPATEESDGIALMDALYQLYFPDFDPSSEDLPEELDGGLM